MTTAESVVVGIAVMVLVVLLTMLALEWVSGRGINVTGGPLN